MKKKLIEVALPLEAINTESAREKSIRHGHPSTLHLWWARRPLAASRAVIWSSLVDDPSSHPEQFPTEVEQNHERNRLFAILEKLVKWENSNNQEVLSEAKAEIMKSTFGNPPALLDLFAGGGSIPLEAQRLGLEAHASDLNPVAVMINKAMIEIPPKFSGMSPVNPDSRINVFDSKWAGASGLAADVRYYGEWMKKEAYKRIGHLYPKVKDEYGYERTVIAWIWARTVKCPNPACGCEMPLVRSFELSKKGEGAYIDPILNDGKLMYLVKHGKKALSGTINRSGAKCVCCSTPVKFPYIREEGQNRRMGRSLLAVIAEGQTSRIYVSPSKEQVSISSITRPSDYPDADLPYNPRNFQTPNYGMSSYAELFSNRQLVALTTLSDLVKEVEMQVEADSIEAGLHNDRVPLSKGGCGAKAYSQAIATYLAFAVDRQANYSSTLNAWGGEFIVQTFGRQAVPMVWDYAESNPFSNSTGCWTGAVNWVALAMERLPINSESINGFATQHDAQSDINLRNIVVSTDPPYYDNIIYADLADYFYIWMRRSLKDIYPDLFKTLLVPKKEELVAAQYRFGGDVSKARDFFEDGMLKAFKQVYLYSSDDIPVTVYYAFKQSESEEDESGAVGTASTGWETMLSAIVQAGFSITGTWPMRTERATGLKVSFNSLASSIVLVCRKRKTTSPICTRRDFINTLKREMKPALQKLQASNIAPVDLAQSAIGPGMGVYSRFSQVLEADGTPMSVRSALQIINQELDHYFTEQDGELDRDSRFCVDLYTQYAFNDMKFGEADVLARAKNTSVEKLAGRGVLYAQKGVVRLLTREEITEKIETKERNIWLLTQQLTHALEKDGVSGAAKIVANIFTSDPEHAKALAYRLFTVAERKGWAGEAYAYNSLVIAWPDVQSKAAELQAQYKNAEQMSLFDVKINN